MRRLWLLVLAAACLPGADDAAVRARRLQERLIAPCCWSESVAVHRSGDAEQMREEIARMVQAGRSDSEIIEKYVAQYGERILLEPRGGRALWLTVGPVVAVILGMLALAGWLYSRRPRAAAAAPSAAAPIKDDDLDW